MAKKQKKGTEASKAKETGTKAAKSQIATKSKTSKDKAKEVPERKRPREEEETDSETEKESVESSDESNSTDSESSSGKSSRGSENESDESSDSEDSSPGLEDGFIEACPEVRRIWPSKWAKSFRNFENDVERLTEKVIKASNAPWVTEEVKILKSMAYGIFKDNARHIRKRGSPHRVANTIAHRMVALLLKVTKGQEAATELTKRISRMTPRARQSAKKLNDTYLKVLERKNEVTTPASGGQMFRGNRGRGGFRPFRGRGGRSGTS